MASRRNAAQILFDSFFHGPTTRSKGRYTRKAHVRHQGEREMARRRRQMANGTHGL